MIENGIIGFCSPMANYTPKPCSGVILACRNGEVVADMMFRDVIQKAMVSFRILGAVKIITLGLGYFGHLVEPNIYLSCPTQIHWINTFKRLPPHLKKNFEDREKLEYCLSMNPKLHSYSSYEEPFSALREICKFMNNKLIQRNFISLQ